MKLLDKYVLVAFLKNYLISFMVLIGLYIVLDLVFNFDELIEVQTHGGASGLASFLSVAYVIWDYYFYQAFPIYAQLSGVIAVAAAAFTLVRFSRFNELSAILAAGVPLLRVAAPIIIAALCLNVLLLVDQEIVIPKLIPKLTRKHDEIGPNAVPRASKIDAMQDEQGNLLFAAKYTAPAGDSPAVMYAFDLVERDANNQPIAHVSADRAVYDSTSRHWRLTNGLRTSGIQPNQSRRERAVSEYPVPPARGEHAEGGVSPEEIALFRSGDYVELLSTARIDELLQHPKSYGTIDLLRAKHARVTQWFMNVIMTLLGIATILTREPGRLKIDGIKLLLIVGAAMASVFICHQLATHPPPGEQWADRWPALMAWLPIFLFGPAAIVLLDRMHTQKS